MCVFACEEVKFKQEIHFISGLIHLKYDIDTSGPYHYYCVHVVVIKKDCYVYGENKTTP
jgi:hypothetical protein